MDPISAEIFGALAGGVGANLLAELIESWARLRATKDKEELESPEWRSLEQSYMKHLEWRFQYPAKVFGQQMISSWIITLLVVLLVVGGLAFSFIQLRWALQLGNLSSLETELAVQTAGELSFRSSLVGATVLVISLLFFYLYLRHVFEVKYPVPPHVSLAETDAARVWRQAREELAEQMQFEPAKSKGDKATTD